MFLIVGLGNPGPKYAGTRHNVGFMALDFIAGKNNLAFTESKWKAAIAKTLLFDKTVVLLKPETLMNLSGTAVMQAVHFFKLQPAEIIVLHDDLDIELGRIKIAANGGDGGHRGVRSIIEYLGTKDFARIKIGIGRPPLPVAPDKFVLGKLDSHELEIIEGKMPLLLEGIRIFLQQGVPAAMTVLNQKD